MPPHAATGLNLNDEERFSLMKFRKSVADCLTLPYHDDHFLLRWLKARNFDPVAAEKMLRASMQWREKWKVESLQDWTPPEVFQKYYPSGVCGFDREGSPVVVIPFEGIDIWGLLHSATKNEFIQMAIRTCEAFLALARAQREQHGINATKVIAILDLTGFNIKQYAWRPAAEAVLAIIQMYEANYPEILKACYIINVPKVFALAFSVVKKFLNEYTISKIHIYKADPNKWKPILLSHIDPDQLPVIYGGTMTDPDGDPKCPLKIRPGGKVPKSYYTKNQEEKLTDDKEFTVVNIKKGDKVTLDYIVPQEGSFLRWCFHSDGHDIKFGVSCKEMDGKETQLVPLNRVPCYPKEEEGFITCNVPATYTVTFDNTYSYMRAKKIFYSIVIAPPLELDTDNIRDVEE